VLYLGAVRFSLLVSANDWLGKLDFGTSEVISCEDCSWNDWLCVAWDIKPNCN